MLDPKKLSSKAVSIAIAGTLALSPFVYPMSAFAYQGYTSEDQVLADKSLSDKEKKEIIAGLKAEVQAAAEAKAAAEALAAEEAAAAEAASESAAVEVVDEPAAEVSKEEAVADPKTTETTESATSEADGSKVIVEDKTKDSAASEKSGSEDADDGKAVAGEKSEDVKDADKTAKEEAKSEDKSSKAVKEDKKAASDSEKIASEDKKSASEEKSSEKKVNSKKEVTIKKENKKIKNINELKNAAPATSSVFESKENNSTVAFKHNVNLTTEAFIASIAPISQILCQDNDMYASVMIAQAIIESGSGTSGLSKAPNNNLFGVKGSYKGESVNMATSEDPGDGTNYNTRANFAKYPSTFESMEAYVDLIKNNGAHYYDGALKSNTETYEDACRYLQGRYASSTIYAQTLINTIETYDLTKYDEELDYKITGQIYDPEGIIEEGGDPELTNGMRDLTMKDYAKLLATATAQLGTDYVWGGTTPLTGFDCSGLTSYVYKEALDMNISRTTYTQQYKGEEVNFEDLRMGDLLFFVDGGDTHHVAMYVGNGMYIHAPQTGDVVKITAMEDYTPTFAKRLIQFEKVEKEDEVTPVDDENFVGPVIKKETNNYVAARAK